MIVNAALPHTVRAVAAVLALGLAMAVLPAGPAHARGMQVASFDVVDTRINPCTNQEVEVDFHLTQRWNDHVTPTGRELRALHVQGTWVSSDGFSGRAQQTTTEMYPDPDEPSSVINHTVLFRGRDAQGRIVHAWERVIVRETADGWDVKLEDIGWRCLNW